MDREESQVQCVLCAAVLSDKEIDASRAMAAPEPGQLYCNGCRRRFHGCSAVRHNPGS